MKNKNLSQVAFAIALFGVVAAEPGYGYGYGHGYRGYGGYGYGGYRGHYYGKRWVSFLVMQSEKTVCHINLTLISVCELQLNDNDNYLEHLFLRTD